MLKTFQGDHIKWIFGDLISSWMESVSFANGTCHLLEEKPESLFTISTKWYIDNISNWDVGSHQTLTEPAPSAFNFPVSKIVRN